ncbi:MAG: hypothetical protein ACLPX1_11685 [Steroidobacteraceae bacterium]
MSVVPAYIGPNPPARKEAKWVYTAKGKYWFPWFRFYAPGKAVEGKK